MKRHALRNDATQSGDWQICFGRVRFKPSGSGTRQNRHNSVGVGRIRFGASASKSQIRTGVGRVELIATWD
jgi:hypothetical protein